MNRIGAAKFQFTPIAQKQNDFQLRRYIRRYNRPWYTYIFGRSRISISTLWQKPKVGQMCVLSDIPRRNRSRTSVCL